MRSRIARNFVRGQGGRPDRRLIVYGKAAAARRATNATGATGPTLHPPPQLDADLAGFMRRCDQRPLELPRKSQRVNWHRPAGSVDDSR